MNPNTGEIYDFSKLEEEEQQKLLKEGLTKLSDDAEKEAIELLDGEAKAKADLTKESAITELAKETVGKCCPKMHWTPQYGWYCQDHKKRKVELNLNYTRKRRSRRKRRKH